MNPFAQLRLFLFTRKAVAGIVVYHLALKWKEIEASLADAKSCRVSKMQNI